MKILVTGSAGFIGSHLATKLLEQGHEVTGLDNINDYYSVKQKEYNLSKLIGQKNFTFVKADFCIQEIVEKLFAEKKFDTVAHIGAMANVRHSVKFPLDFTHVNVTGTCNLLEESVKHGVNNFVLASTGSVYGQRDVVPFNESEQTDGPLAVYAASKRAAELLGYSYQNMHKLNFTALRFFNVYGPSGRPDMMPFRVAKALLTGEKITIFDNGNIFRDWTYVDDIVQGLILAINNPAPYEIYNIGRGQPVELTEFIKMMERLVGKTANVENVPAPLSEPKITFADITKAKNKLGFSPSVNLDQGLELFWEWYKHALSQELV